MGFFLVDLDKISVALFAYNLISQLWTNSSQISYTSYQASS
ncbi:hypothetical protein V6Z12_D04G080300 [Gossypium hirsutum]